jgi:hypothetical protein
VCLQNYSPPHFERLVRILRPSNWLENHRWIYRGLETHERSHVVCDIHLCIPILSIKVMKSPMIFSIGHLDPQFQTTYRSIGIFIGETDRTNTFWQLCIRTWNFPWGFSELSHSLSLHFIVVTIMVLELCALGFFTIGHMHETVFWVFFYTVSYRNPKLFMRFFWVKLHIEFTFHHRDPYGSGVKCPWTFYYRTYACNSFPSPKAGPLVMASITHASSCLCSSLKSRSEHQIQNQY